MEKFGAWTFTKGLMKFVAANEGLKRAVFPAIKASYTPEGQDYKYEPITLSDLIGVKTETPEVKIASDAIEMGMVGGIAVSGKLLRQAKIDTVINEALPSLEKLFIERGVKIPRGGLTPEFVKQQAQTSSTLGEAIIQAADRLPIYKAFGNRGAVRLPSFNPGDEVKIGSEMAKVIKTEGENVILEIGGAQVVKKIADISPKQPEIKPETPVSGIITPEAAKGGGIMYHQSQGDTGEFLQKGDKGYKRAGYSQAGEGIYFSPNKELVQSKYGKGGGKLVSAQLDIKNPLDLGDKDAMYFDGRKVNYGDVVVENFKRFQSGEKPLPEPDIILSTISKKAKRWLIDNGYDAVTGMKGEMWTAPETVIFDKSQIKLSTPTGEGKVAESAEKVEEVKPPLSGEVKKQRGFITSIQEEMPELKVSGQYIPRSTDKLAIKARNVIKDDIRVAEKMAQGTDDTAIATGAELLKHYSIEAEKATDETIKDVFYEKAAELGNDMAKRLTELGRSVQAASILARLTPEGQIRFAAKTIQKYNEEITKTKGGLLGLKKLIPELTPEQTREIIDAMQEIQEMPDGEARAIRFRDLQNYISDLVPTPIYDKIVTLWKAGLLTGLKTSGVNLLANFSHAFGTEVIKDVPAVMVDSLASLFTGKRTTTFTLKGVEGVKEGISKGWRFLKTGYDERNVLTKLDYQRANFGKSKIGRVLQVYEESVFKLLGAEDQPFYYGAKARSLYDQAGAQAINSGLKGAKAKVFIDNLVSNPTDEMLLYAVADAETAVFQNKTVLSEAAGHLRKIAGAEFIVPFTKTPSAVAMQILNYSPVGITKTIFQNAGKGKFDQRDFSKGTGRGLVGVAILAMGAYLFRKEVITLDRPASEGERKMWELESRKANSIKVGNKYRSVQVLGPAGNLLLIGAQFQNAFNKSGSPTEAMAKGTFGSLKAFSEQTYLTGISSGLEAFKEPERMGESFAGGLISSVIPTIMADIAKATDPLQRRAENIMQRVMARVPILSQALEPQVDILGERRPRTENFLETIADPTRPSTEIKEPVTREIRRLIDTGQKISTTQVGDRKGYRILTQKQNTDLWQRAGSIAYEKIMTLMEIPAYETAPDDLKAKKVNEILDKAKVVARAEKLIEITTDLSGDDLKSKLSEAKKDGLLNREVYNLFIRMR
ncbi:MAG: hypothetical protein WC404_00260 [Candidatus Omnitrophota bacterium]